MEQKTKLTLGGLFEGIGGFPLAATWAGITPVWSNEIDPFCCKVLNKNFDHEIIQKDIREIGKHNLPRVDIISGGVPCQPASLAGKRKGKDDDRWLWPEAIRVVSELKPAVAIFENPPGILSLENGRAFRQILIAMEDEGYEIEIFNIPACSLGAWHQRERIWIIAYSCTQGLSQPTRTEQQGIQRQEETQQGSELGGAITEGWEYWQTEPGVDRMVHGLPNRVDRIKGLGNAIVPQVAYEIFKAILETYQPVNC